MSPRLKRLCSAAEIAEGTAAGVADETMLALHRDGQFHVYRNRCPHLGTPLNWLPDRFMDPDGALLQCSTHGALFLPHNGLCISGPCVGRQLERVECILRDGDLFVVAED